MLQPKQVWRCDICRIRTFPSFQEACDHEAQCCPPLEVASVSAEEESSSKVTDRSNCTIVVSSSVIHPLMKSKKRPLNEYGTTASTAIEVPTSNSKLEPHSSSRVNRRKIPNKEDDEVLVIETPLTNIFTKKTGRNRTSVSSKDGPLSSSSKTTSAKKGASASKKRSKNSITQPPLLEWLTCVPEETSLKDDSSFLTEQVVAYQFMEQRRLKQQNEREKMQRQQQRRREQELLKSTTTASVSTNHDVMIPAESLSSIRTAPSHSSKSSSRCQPLLMAVRFPHPSHVFTASAADEIPDETALATPRNWWKPIHRPEVEPCPQIVMSSLLSDSPLMDPAEVLQTTIRRYLTLSNPPNMKNSSAAIVDQKNIGGLWTDRYYISSSTHLEDESSKNQNVCFGASQKMAQDQLKRFIERYMMERQKIEELSKEKQKQRILSFQSQEKRAKFCRKKLNSQRSKTDDDFWDDDYDSEDGVPKVESSLCLLSGPVGCGKSHLVHAVAKRLGCRKVLELHTGMRRNAASIKRLIEEATKSHSTFDMIHNCNSASIASSKVETVEPVRKVRHRKVIASDSEESEDEQQKPGSEDRGSAVTVILIDEVDNLDPSTDHGFWTALSDLCKQSKCPIVCTANCVPSGLKSSSSFGWIHVPVERPTPIECAHRLQEICSVEGLSLRPVRNSLSSTDPWQVIAEAGNCDMRRLLHELQSFQLIATELPESTEEIDLTPKNDPICHTPESHLSPRIDSIRPRSIPMNEYCLLTIKGFNFWKLVDPKCITDHGSPCEVYIGDFLCPEARILDDSTVLTVAPPLHFPRRVESENSKFHSLYSTPSYSLTLVPVRVCSLRKFGLASTTNVSVETLALPDETSIYVASSPCLLEYRYNCKIENEESESENEFGHDNLSRNSTTGTRRVVNAFAPQYPNINACIVSQLLEEGIKSWHSTNAQVHFSNRVTDPPVDSMSIDDVQALNDLCAKAALASDAALFDSLTMTPFLSGSCRGFGFDYTEEFPKRNNENSKPPSEERLIASGWKENCNFYGTGDAYMVRLSSRERKLLHWHELSVRGVSPIYAETLDSEETAESPPLTSEMTEEDYLVPVHRPSSMLDLPRSLSTSSQTPLLNCANDEYVCQKKMKELLETLTVARDYIFAQPKYTRVLSRLLSNPLLCPHFKQSPSVSLDFNLFLDYLPLLRCMAVQERVSECLFQLQESSNDGSLLRNHGRRSTRRSLKRGREQYFETLVPSYVFEESNKTAKDIVELLANASLLYER